MSRALLGGRLGLSAGAARVWWPGLTLDSAPSEHPLVSLIDYEDKPNMLAEFERAFDLSRPAVRQEINLIEDARALLSHELATETEKTRALKTQLNKVIARAEAAEARNADLTQQLKRRAVSADRGQDEH
jgi:hypothetical protein